MSQFIILFKKEWLELIRSKKLLIMIVLLLFVSISSPILAKLIPSIFKNIEGIGPINIPESTWKDAVDQFVKNANQFVGLVIVFMFAGAIAEEKNKKTLEIVLTKPISRASFLLAKFLSGSLLITICMTIGSVIFYYYAVSIFGSFSLQNFVFLAVVLHILFSVILALTIFASTIANTQIIAIAIAFFVEIVSLAVLPYIDAIKNYLPTYVSSNYKEMMINGEFQNFMPSIYTSLVLIFLFIASSILIFKRQEVER
jgi:ABC-2 type transport system permease protein